MRVDHAGHQRRAHAVDHGGAGRRRRGRAVARGAARDLLDAVALHQHLAGVGIFAGRIEDAHIGEQHIAGAVAVPAVAIAVPAVIFVCHVNLPVVSAGLPAHRGQFTSFSGRPAAGNQPAAWLHSCTFSIVAQWPQRSMVLNVAPLILSASACATLTRIDRVGIAGHQQRRRIDQPRIDRACLGQRLAGARIGFRILPHDRFPHEGDRGRIGLAGLRRQRVGDDLVGNVGHAARARQPGPLGQRLARRRRAARQARRTASARRPAPARPPRSAGRRWFPSNGRRNAPWRRRGCARR